MKSSDHSSDEIAGRMEYLCCRGKQGRIAGMKEAMKGLFGLACLMLPLMSTADISHFEKIGDVTWNFEVTEGRATVTKAKPAMGSLVIPNSIDGYPVTRVECFAFCGCTGLTSVTISEGATSIGGRAFSGCSGLTSVTIPEGVTNIGYNAFSGCSGLTSVTIPQSVRSIGDEAFSGCSGLTSVTIPKSVTKVGEAAFAGCVGLSSLTLPFVGERRSSSSDTDSFLGYHFLFGHIFGDELCSGVVKTPQAYDLELKRGNGGLYDLSLVTNYQTCCLPIALKTVVVTDATEIKRGAFYGCIGLTSVTIPEGVTNIGEWAFLGCAGLTSVTIPEGVTSIGKMAFSGCAGLTSVTIPKSVSKVGEAAFEGCLGLTSLTLPFVGERRGNRGSSNSRFANIFGDTAYTISENRACKRVPMSLKTVSVTDETEVWDEAFEYCNGLKSVTIPEGVTKIGDRAFSGCSGLTSVAIPKSVRSIGTEAFKGCCGLTSVTIPGSVTNVGLYAFSGCTGLTSVVISEGATSIGGRAFSGCPGLTSVKIPKSVTKIGGCAFEGSPWQKEETRKENERLKKRIRVALWIVALVLTGGILGRWICRRLTKQVVVNETKKG